MLNIFLYVCLSLDSFFDNCVFSSFVHYFNWDCLLIGEL